MVWIAHCVSWVISRTLTAILPDFQFQWLNCPSKMISVTYFTPHPRDNSTKTYSILLIPFGFVAYFSDGRKSKNSVNFLVVSCAVVIGRTSRQPNYPNQFAPKRGSERSLRFGPQSHLVSLSGNLPIVQARDTLSRGSYQPIVLAKPLMAPLISCS